MTKTKKGRPLISSSIEKQDKSYKDINEVMAEKIKYKYKIILPKKNKYKNVPCEWNGFKFQSKLERDYYKYLLEEQKRGAISWILRQVPVHIRAGRTYRIDFMFSVVGFKGEFVRFVETKGYMTKGSEKKMQEASNLLGVGIEIIKRGDF